MYIFCHLFFYTLVLLSLLSAANQNKSRIYIFLPVDASYPEYNIYEIAKQGKQLFEEKFYPDISIVIERLENDRDGNVVSDSRITNEIVQNYYAGVLDGCIGLLHSTEALEMVTFFEIPTITYSSYDFLNYGCQVSLNPRYENATKSIFRILKQFNWTRVNFVFSTLPWYKDIGDYFYNNLATFKEESYQEKLRDEINGFNFTIDEPADEMTQFKLENERASEQYFVNLLNKMFKTANILVLVGHACELKRMIVTAYTQGFLKPGRVVLYIDSYGQMTNIEKTNCTGFSGWGYFDQDPIVVKESMKYVVYGISHWEDNRKQTYTRKMFDKKYNPTHQASDNSGFDMMLIDSLTVLTSYINSTRYKTTNSTLLQYTKLTNIENCFVSCLSGGCSISENCLYSGQNGFNEHNMRDIKISVEFYHGDGDIHILGWEDCNELYCKQVIDPGNRINWAGGVKPSALVEREDEKETHLVVILGPIIGALILSATLAFLTTRFYKVYKAKSSIKIWGLDKHDFDFSQKQVVDATNVDGMFPKSYTNLTRIRGKYKNFDVFIKEISGFKINITDNYELSLDILIQKAIEHDNINPLIGIRMMDQDIQIVRPYCSKGSLMDVLKCNPMNINDHIEYKLHILKNIADGMAYLHNTSKMCHGNLKSTNCLVDSRWVVKITDFEPEAIRSALEEDGNKMENHYAQELWTAPELVAEKKCLDKKKMKMCDVYSFAIICFEVLANTLPYHEDGKCLHSYSEIITRVKESSEPPFRPTLKRKHCHNNEEIYTLVRRCWEQRPTLRHPFNWISVQLENISSGEDFGDFLATQMEKYSHGLDQMIEEMEANLKKERYDYETLLQDMLPRQVAASIKAGRQPPFETSEVSLYFSDMYNFSKISGLRDFKDNPKLIVEFLNMVYGILDTIVGCFDTKLYKVETINDSYLVMSGLPVRQDSDNLHAGYIANFALHVLSRVNEIEIEGHPDLKVQIRIGIHSGQVAAGVIGKLNPRYCLFGDTVNFTSRLESTGIPFTIHTSEKTVGLLKQSGSLFRVVARKERVTLKNRGEHQTYFLVGMEGFEWELPKATKTLDKYGDLDKSESTSQSSGPTRNDRKISACSTATDYSCTDTGISSAVFGSSTRSKKLSSSFIYMQDSIMTKCSMLLMDKMKKPDSDKLDVCQQERPSRRAFSEPNGNYKNISFREELRKQRSSTPFRKISESLYHRGEEGVPEPLTEPLDCDIECDPFIDGHVSPSISKSEDSMELHRFSRIGDMDLACVYNHYRPEGRVSVDEQDLNNTYLLEPSACKGLSIKLSDSDQKSASSRLTDSSYQLSDDDDEDQLVTPTDTLPKDIQRRGTTKTLVAPSGYQLPPCSDTLEHLSGVSMGVKKYSFKRTSANQVKNQNNDL